MGFDSRLQRLLEKFYELITIVLNIGLVVSGVWLHASFEHNWLIFGVSLVVMLGLASLDFLLKRLHDRTKARSTYESYLNKLLEAAAISMLRAVNPPSPHIRANLMLLDNHTNKLYIKYSYGFDFRDQDRGILIPVGTGCAGYALVNGQAAIADVTLLSRPSPEGVTLYRANEAPVLWGLPLSEVAKVRHSLKAIFSTPFTFGKHDQYSAILNFDSDNSISEMRFDDENIQKIAFCHVQTFQALLTDMYQ